MAETEKPDWDTPETAPTQGLSRRDFLRRASSEAVKTGSRIVPGAAIAQHVLGVGAPDAEKKTGLSERWAAWRRQRQSEREKP